MNNLKIYYFISYYKQDKNITFAHKNYDQFLIF